MVVVYKQMKVNRSTRWALFFCLYAGIMVAEIPDNFSLCPEPAITCLALKRFYIIARLEKMCHRFFATPVPITHPALCLLPASVQTVFAHTITHPALTLLADIAPFIRHEHIRLHVQAAIESKSIKPVHTLWKELCAYRFLGDDLFTQEFCQVIYMAGSGRINPITLDKDTQWLATKKALDQMSGHYADAIAQRFYLIQRLQRPIKVCRQVYAGSGDPECMVLLKLWDDIQEYKNIDTIAASFGICTTLMDLLKSALNDKAASISQTLESSADELTAETTFADLELLLERIDTLTDRYPYTQAHR